MPSEIFPTSNAENSSNEQGRAKVLLEQKIHESSKRLEDLIEAKKSDQEVYETKRKRLLQEARVAQITEKKEKVDAIITKLDVLKNENENTLISIAIKTEREMLNNLKKELSNIQQQEQEKILNEKLEQIKKIVEPIRLRLDTETNNLYERLEILQKEYIEPLAAYGMNEKAARIALKENRNKPGEERKAEAVREMEVIEENIGELNYLEESLKEIDELIDKNKIPSIAKIEKLDQEITRVINRKTKLYYG